MSVSRSIWSRCLTGSLLFAIQSVLIADEATTLFGDSVFQANGSPGYLAVPEASAQADAQQSWGEQAKSILARLANRYGIENVDQDLSVERESVDLANNRHIHLQQRYKGIEVDGAMLSVHFNQHRAIAITGSTLRNLALSLKPAISKEEANEIALDHVEFGIERSPFLPAQAQNREDLTIADTRLVVYNREAARGSWGKQYQLAYRVTVVGPSVREFVYVEAQKGRILDNFTGIVDVRNRNTYDAMGRESHTGARLVRNESSGVSGDADVDNAHSFAGDTYNFYFNGYGRDSIDGRGMALNSYTHYGRGFQNAFWDGSKMTYGDGFPVDDVVAHELTHGVTEKTAGLTYYKQSGALNESMSDIIGETVDQINGKGNDSPTVKWEMGEDVPDFGTLRDMKNPPRFENPDKVTSNHYYCGSQDNGGVHLNSGVPNKNYYLLVEGGTFNGRTVKALGMIKAAAIHYHNLTHYLGKYSQFSSHYFGLWRSCHDLKGVALKDPATGSTTTQVITADDCNQVLEAGKAVEFTARACR